MGHAPDNSCRSCGADLLQVGRKPSDVAHYQYYCLECSRRRHREYSRRYNKKPRSRARGRAYVARLKLAVLGHYSPELRCQCELLQCWHSGSCPIHDSRLLCIDHISGGGRRHTESLGRSAGAGFYNWLKKNGFPEGFQVLCQNCNWMKTYVNHEHPRID